MLAPTQLAKEVIAYRELLWALTYRDIRVKYKQAVMGVLWAFFLPVLSIAAGVLVQAALAYLSGSRLDAQRIGSVMVRTVPWGLFVGVLSATANGILGGMGLASKIYFPRQIIPLSATLGVLFDWIISAVVVALVLVLIPGSPLQYSWHLLLLPVLLLILLAQGLGLGLIFGSGNVFFRDVKYILGVLLQFGIFFTPVYLFLDQLPAVAQRVMIWNPVAPVLEAMSYVAIGHRDAATGALVTGVPAWLWPMLGYSAGCGLLALYAGMAIFRRTEKLFAEVM